MNKGQIINDDFELTDEYKRYLFKKINENDNIIKVMKNKVNLKRKVIKYGIYLIILLSVLMFIILLISLIKKK